jgi:hypothetical protein
MRSICKFMAICRLLKNQADVDFNSEQIKNHQRGKLIMKLTGLWILLGTVCLQGLDIAARADVLDNWTTNQVTTNSAALKHIAYGNGRYVAVGERGDEGDIYSSEDGVHWVLRYTDQNSWGLTLTYANGSFFGIGGLETALSADGTNWNVSFTPDYLSGLGNYYNIAFGNGLYVEVGYTNYFVLGNEFSAGAIVTSPDGTNWTHRPSTPAAGAAISSVTSGASKFVAIGNNDGFEYTSPAIGINAGKNWTRSNIPGGNQISFGNGLFIVPLTSNSNLLSADGITWTMKNTGLTNMLGKVVFANGLFLARVGSYLATSSDGTNWFQYPQLLPGDATGDATIATDGSRLLTIGSTIVDFNFHWNSFVYASEVLVAVRQTNRQPAKVVLSGLLGRNYQIQSADTLTTSPNNWRTNTTLQLTNTPYLWTDATATNSQRFYRGVLMP